MNKLLVALLKVGISVAILAYLAVQAHQNSVFEDLAARPKHWGLLAAAAGTYVVAVGVTFVRWCYLVRALDLPFPLRDAVRLGSLGLLFNLAPMGIVSGDLLKAVMLARHQNGFRAKSLASVFVDRVIGLFALFLVATAAVLLTGLWQSPIAKVRAVCQAVLVVTAVAAVTFPLPILPDVTRGAFLTWIGRWPYVGRKLRSLIETMRMYRFRPGALAVSLVMSVAVHVLLALVIYMIAAALYADVPTLGTHMVVVPVSNSTQVIPVLMGPFEMALDYFYAALPLPDGGRMVAGQGLVVALGYRILMVLLAAVGLVYYFGSRREVAEVMHERECGESDLDEETLETPDEELVAEPSSSRL